jgi:hypothetical protein
MSLWPEGLATAMPKGGDAGSIALSVNEIRVYGGNKKRDPSDLAGGMVRGFTVLIKRVKNWQQRVAANREVVSAGIRGSFFLALLVVFGMVKEYPAPP